MKVTDREFIDTVNILQAEMIKKKDLTDKKNKTIKRETASTYIAAVFEAIRILGGDLDGTNHNKIYTGIGDFYAQDIKEKVGRNFKTKESMVIPAKKVLKFVSKIKY